MIFWLIHFHKEIRKCFSTKKCHSFKSTVSWFWNYRSLSVIKHLLFFHNRVKIHFHSLHKIESRLIINNMSFFIFNSLYPYSLIATFVTLELWVVETFFFSLKCNTILIESFNPSKTPLYKSKFHLLLYLFQSIFFSLDVILFIFYIDLPFDDIKRCIFQRFWEIQNFEIFFANKAKIQKNHVINMKYLEVPSLSVLSSKMNQVTQSDMKLNCRIELYSCEVW